MAAEREKELICGTEEEIVVAHGRLPSPARYASAIVRTLKKKDDKDYFFRKFFFIGEEKH